MLCECLVTAKYHRILHLGTFLMKARTGTYTYSILFLIFQQRFLPQFKKELDELHNWPEIRPFFILVILRLYESHSKRPEYSVHPL